jgi:hypothetical protein
MAQIKNVKGYALDLISVVDQGVDGSRQLRSVTTAAPWPLLQRGSPGATSRFSR